MTAVEKLEVVISIDPRGRTRLFLSPVLAPPAGIQTQGWTDGDQRTGTSQLCHKPQLHPHSSWEQGVGKMEMQFKPNQTLTLRLTPFQPRERPSGVTSPPERAFPTAQRFLPACSSPSLSHSVWEVTEVLHLIQERHKYSSKLHKPKQREQLNLNKDRGGNKQNCTQSFHSSGWKLFKKTKPSCRTKPLLWLKRDLTPQLCSHSSQSGVSPKKQKH